MTYKVTDRNGRTITPGTIITDFRGDEWEFDTLSRAPQPGKSAKVTVRSLGYREFYAEVFDLKVEEV